MAFSTTQYVACAEMDSSFQLSGDRALNPLVPGQTIIAHGTFDDGQETGPAGFVVLRNVGKHAGMQTYLLAPIGCTDPYWGDHLSKTPQVRACVMRSLKDPVPTGAELLRRWRVVADAGKEPNRDDFSSFGKTVADAVKKKWGFLNELVVADGHVPQARWRPTL